MNELVAAVDIGTSKICVLCGQATKTGGAEVLASGVASCDGARKGAILDIEAVAAAVAEAARQCEASAGLKIGSAYVNVMGLHVDVITNRRGLPVSGEDGAVHKKDVDRLLHIVRDVYVPSDSQIIDIVPRQYIVDGYGGVADPVGMAAADLELEADIVTGKVASISNILRCVERAGLRIDGLVISGQALGEVALTREEREMGVIVIDVGGSVTDVSVFKNGRLCFYESAPLGGDSITGDIAYIMRVTYAEAEKIKKEYGLALASLISADQELMLTDINDNEKKRVNISEIVDVIEARVYETLEICRGMLDAAGVSLEFGAGVVLAGGGISCFDGVKQIAYQVFGLPVKVFPARARAGQRTEALLAEGIVRQVVKTGKGKRFASDVQSQKARRQGAQVAGFGKKAVDALKRLF